MPTKTVTVYGNYGEIIVDRGTGMVIRTNQDPDQHDIGETYSDIVSVDLSGLSEDCHVVDILLVKSLTDRDGYTLLAGGTVIPPITEPEYAA